MMRRGSMFWGLVLIIVGILFLLNTMGLLAVNVWGIIWPVFLVVLGLWITSGALMSPRARDLEPASVPLAGATRARVTIHHGAGQLTVNSGASSGALLEGSFGGGLDCSTRRNGDELVANLSMRVREWWGLWSWNPGGFNWDVRFTDSIPLALEFETGAGETRMDLTKLKVDDVRVKTGASSTDIALPALAGSTRVRVEAGAASVVLRVPQGVAARIQTRGGLAGIDVNTSRFPRSGDVYQSPDYDGTANRVDVDAEVGVGSIQVR